MTEGGPGATLIPKQVGSSEPNKEFGLTAPSNPSIIPDSSMPVPATPATPAPTLPIAPLPIAAEPKPLVVPSPIVPAPVAAAPDKPGSIGFLPLSAPAKAAIFPENGQSVLPVPTNLEPAKVAREAIPPNGVVWPPKTEQPAAPAVIQPTLSGPNAADLTPPINSPQPIPEAQTLPAPTPPKKEGWVSRLASWAGF